MAVAGAAWGLLLTQLSPPAGAWLTATILVAVGSLLEPLAGLGAALLVGPMWAWLRAELPSVPPLLGQYMLALTAAAWIIRHLLRRDLRLPTPPLLVPLLAFLGVTLLSLWSPADPWSGLMEWLKWFQILLALLIVDDRLQGRGDGPVITLIAALMGAALIQAAVGLWQFGLRGEGPAHFAINTHFYRAYGTFEQPNPFAGFLGMTGATAVGITAGLLLDARLHHRRPSEGMWAMGATAMGIVAALGASWSRGGWMGFGAAMLVMAALLPRRNVWGWLLVALVIALSVTVHAAGLLPPAIADRLTGFLAYVRFEDVRGVGINDANYAVIERMAHWQAALAMWRAHFWLGVGFGCYEAAYPNYRLINWPFALGHAHNYYLNVLAETGLIGLMAYLWLMGAVFAALVRATRRLEGWQRGLAVGLAGAWTHLAVHSLVDNLLVNNVHLHFGAMLALAAWLVTQSADAPPRPAPPDVDPRRESCVGSPPGRISA